jgi:hypothetical protein
LKERDAAGTALRWFAAYQLGFDSPAIGVEWENGCEAETKKMPVHDWAIIPFRSNTRAGPSPTR